MLPSYDVHPGLAVRERRHVERGAGLDQRRVQRRLDLRPGRAAVGRAPDAARVRRRRRRSPGSTGRARRARTPRGEQTPPLANSARVAGAVGGGRGAVVDEAPGRAAVGGLVEAPLGGVRHGAGDARAARPRTCRAAPSSCRRRWCSGSPGLTMISPMPLPPSGFPVRAPSGPGPGVAAVGRLVDADAGHAAGAADVRLAGADVDRVAGRVVGVDRHRAGRVDPERARRGTPSAACRPARSSCARCRRRRA